ncbi:MAG: hypothetical protein Q8S11_02535 [Daejeonella sp.]|uniref:hypothetical protein n=1 Tax=Daejeonella sp. TaxID=2805397 RepID=UPI0027345845|nr:hypothetical protein [Daejeonella sp.]MDP3467182.1 hypothetical protein [Daejeonella sp.]
MIDEFNSYRTRMNERIMIANLAGVSIVVPQTEEPWNIGENLTAINHELSSYFI